MAVFHVSISKAALALVKAGKATISSGGVRALNGEMIEMFVPVVKDGIQSIVSVISPLNLMSSVAGNVQNYFIKKEVPDQRICWMQNRKLWKR